MSQHIACNTSDEIINALNCECHMQMSGTMCALEITKQSYSCNVQAVRSIGGIEVLLCCKGTEALYMPYDP